MTSIKLAAVGIALLVIAGTLLVLQRTPPSSAAARSEPAAARAIPASADGSGITVRLYKEPAAVPALNLETIDGRTLTSADLKGKVTLINFWATWCPPCRAEIPDLIALQEKYRDQLLIIGVSQDEAPVDQVRRFADQQKMNYPIVMTTPELERAFPGVSALPTTFVLDLEARLAQKHIGRLSAAMTEHEMRALAGLPTNAAIERVDPDQPVGLANAAQAKEIPGIDLTKLTPEKRVATLQRLNAEPCTCGCELTVAKCRIDDPACGVSLPLARKIAAEIAGAR